MIKKAMPDVVTQVLPSVLSPLRWVGMEEIKLPLSVKLDANREQTVSARVSSYVNLCDPEAKGIHMSRLYLLLEDFADNNLLTKSSLNELLQKMIECHAEISNGSRLVFRFDYHIKRPSLVSSYQGWSCYPVTIDACIINGRFELKLSVEIDYSSTCPCSAALSRQLIQQAFANEFKDTSNLNFEAIHSWLASNQAIVATPHSQRSTAIVGGSLPESALLIPINQLICLVEKVIQTPVQAVVKREDEQEFARLNGQNPQFCEDAARAIDSVLASSQILGDYQVKVVHAESLHGHNAVAETDSQFII
ncbi:GTP cyclohydrolase FolE2 [Ferrimonas senticii]|uniref:GTP cyclohydrolase FolE2 n=1 Tax=Ferrimonas senticii TaxID=394566 RepID=UPI0003F6935C|nr:GTP cyclohydrolase FolE2 [Ferrimonas senticii]